MDVKFTHFRFDECVREGLNEFQSFMEEINISLNLDLSPLEVASDRKIVLFILIQLISNAVKYADDDGRIYLTIQQVKDKIYLGIYNNGDGVAPEDLPFIFDKGFTGNYPNRQ